MKCKSEEFPFNLVIIRRCGLVKGSNPREAIQLISFTLIQIRNFSKSDLFNRDMHDLGLLAISRCKVNMVRELLIYHSQTDFI